MVCPWKEEVACGVFKLPAGCEERFGVFSKTFEPATYVDELGIFEWGDRVEERWVESFTGRIDDEGVVGREGGVFRVDAKVGKGGGILEAGEALLEREMCVGVVFDKVDLFRFVAEGEPDSADACVKFEEGRLGRNPGFDLVDHFFKKGEMGLGKGGGVKGDLRVVDFLPKEGFAVEMLPSVAENLICGCGLKIKPDRMEEAAREKGLGKGFDLRG